MTAPTAELVLAAVAAGHDELYDLTDELGADVSELRGLLDDLVRVGWLDRRDADGVSRYRVTTAAR